MGDAKQDALAGTTTGLAKGPGPFVLGRDRQRRCERGRGGLVGVASAVGTRWFRQAGGMRPISIAPLSGRYLSLAEREEIAILKAKGCGVRDIARHVRRSPSSISRELRRNAATRAGSSGYRAINAQWHADRRARRPKVARLVANDKLREYVQDRLSGLISRPDGTEVPGPTVRFIGRRHGPRQDRRWAKAWSPEQISARLRTDFPDDTPSPTSARRSARPWPVQCSLPA